MNDLISKAELKDYLKGWLAQAQYYHEDEKNDWIPLAEVMAYIKHCKVVKSKVEVLDKIRNEIADLVSENPLRRDYVYGHNYAIMKAVQIIDKYKTESEEQ